MKHPFATTRRVHHSLLLLPTLIALTLTAPAVAASTCILDASSTSAPGSAAFTSGFDAEANSPFSTVIGDSRNAEAPSATALGHDSQAAGGGSIAIGANARALGLGTLALGTSASDSDLTATNGRLTAAARHSPWRS